MERMREHLARADSELRTAQHFLDPGSAEGAEMDLIRAAANARVTLGEALETVRLRLGEAALPTTSSENTPSASFDE